MAQDNDVKAGEYELLDLFWDRRTSDVQDRVQTFHRHVQGEVLDLDEEEAQRLVAGGSVAPAGERQAREAAAALSRFTAALSQVPDSVRAALLKELGSQEAVQDALENAETDPENLTVATAPGLVAEGSPRYASAALGEGTGGGDPQNPDAEVKEAVAVGENPGDGRVDLGGGVVADSAIVSEDDGAKSTRNARRA